MADTIPTDTFSRRLRELTDNPGALRGESTVHVQDFLGNLETWNLISFRHGDTEESFLQCNGAAGALRIYLPPKVTAALARHRELNVSKARRRGARKALETKRTNGTPIGNPAALRAARRANANAKVVARARRRGAK